MYTEIRGPRVHLYPRVYPTLTRGFGSGRVCGPRVRVGSGRCLRCTGIPILPVKKSQSMPVPLITVGESFTRCEGIVNKGMRVHPYPLVYPTCTRRFGSGWVISPRVRVGSGNKTFSHGSGWVAKTVYPQTPNGNVLEILAVGGQHSSL